MDALIATNFSFKRQKEFNRGKVRDIYNIHDDLIVLVASDRISAFDFVLPRAIPFKGQVLSQVASFFLDLTKEIVPNWKLYDPDPQVTIGYKCEPIHIECVVRGYLSGHSWRLYNQGLREICGNKLPEGLKENDRLREPIFTPTTKAKQGHDIDITREQLIEQKLIKKKDLEQLEHYTFELFKAGSEHAETRNLILADTKYEFGMYNGKIILIDEIHTPDSSRYFYKNTYDEIQSKDQQQKQLSKEFVRKWLIENGFQGRKGDIVPEMNNELIASISERYIELYENITGEKFIKRSYENIMEKIEYSVNTFLEMYYEK